MLDHVSQFKGEAKRVIKKNVEYNLYTLAQNGSRFDSYVVLNNLPQGRTVVTSIKNGSRIVPLKLFNGFVDKNKKIPQNVHFRCGLLHFNNSLKKIGFSYILQKSLLKQEMDHDDVYEDTWEDKENEYLPYLESDVLSTAFSYDRYAKGKEELRSLGLKKSTTLAKLANKYFNSSRDESDEPIYNYTDEYMTWFVRQTIKGGRCSSFKQYFKSIVSHEMFKIIS